MRRILLLSYCVFFSMIATAQQKPGVKLLAKSKSGSILLRWAPTNSFAWTQANQKGYRIERFTIARRNEVVKKPEKLLLTSVPLKPKPLEQWKTDAEKNDYSAIAAQAIYGSSFQVTLPQNGSFTEVVNRSKEQEQRFSFALFSADHSFQTAKLSALGFKDSTAKKDERYLYRVYVANQDSKIKLDTGIFYLGVQDTVGLTPPMNLTAQFADRLILLKWPKSFVQQAYTSFIIERSEAGGEFIRRNSAPYINSTYDPESEIFFQVLDSLPKNDAEYQYRIRGVSPFGEIGPESERVSGRGFQTLDAKASITEAKEENGKVNVQWRVIGKRNLITGFYLERASEASKTFQRLNDKPLSPESATYTDQTPLSTNYYRIRTVGSNEQSSTSFPVLVQLVDSIPPAQPQGLKVKVDTTGIAKLSWTSNRETDLLGYRVYRSNFLSAEFSQINPSTLSLASYSDTMNIKTLSTKIFYKLAAFDKRLNRSLFSQVVEAELPDVIPPMPPFIKEIRPEASGILIRWTTSASEDVVSYQLLRKAKDSVQWKLIKGFKIEDSTSYIDRRVRPKMNYQYRMIAIDKGGLKSTPSNSVSVIAPDVDERQSIKDITAEVDRENKSITLKWKYSNQNVSRYLIYRSANGEMLTLYKSVPGNSQGFYDAYLNINTTYNYRVKALLNDGAESGFSKEIRLRY